MIEAQSRKVGQLQPCNWSPWRELNSRAATMGTLQMEVREEVDMSMQLEMEGAKKEK